MQIEQEDNKRAMALLAFVDMGDEPQTNSLYVMTTKFLTESSSVRYALPLDIRGSEISKLPRRSLEATKWAWRSSITSHLDLKTTPKY